ncbi:hypothetical protein ACQ5SO_15080 [Rhodovulum sp. DZ06]|uniref:hypothetical protein n=1 Tax=Rhodovulum sp. DZ06 TaxID=3425126 RepID=UPI003D34FA81
MRLTLALCAVFALSAQTAAAITFGTTTGDYSSGGRITLTNDGAETATDLHFRVQVDDRGNPLNGIDVGNGAFGSTTITRQDDRTVDVTLDAGALAPGESIDIDIRYWIGKENEVWFQFPEWSYPDGPGGDPTPRRPAGPGTGWTWGLPYLCALETWCHDLEIWNVDLAPQLIENLQILATDTPFADFDSVDWAGAQFGLTGPIEILPGEAWTFTLETDDPLYGGAIYTGYDVTGSAAAPGGGTVTTASVVLGEHPIPEPVPLPAAGALMLGALGGLAALRRRG